MAGISVYATVVRHLFPAKTANGQYTSILITGCRVECFAKCTCSRGRLPFVYMCDRILKCTCSRGRLPLCICVIESSSVHAAEAVFPLCICVIESSSVHAAEAVFLCVYV